MEKMKYFKLFCHKNVDIYNHFNDFVPSYLDDAINFCGEGWWHHAACTEFQRRREEAPYQNPRNIPSLDPKLAISTSFCKNNRK